jgi:toxin ParE1/3/4
MAQIVRTEQAQQDLERILDYLDAQSTQLASRFAAKFEQTCDLHAAPQQIGVSAETSVLNLRHFTVWNYVVFYRPTDDGIELIRIIRGARDVAKLFE